MKTVIFSYRPKSVFQALCACALSASICATLTPSASAKDNHLVFSLLKMIDVPKFPAKEIEQRINAIFKIHTNPKRFDSKDLPSHISDPYFWAFAAKASLANDPHPSQKNFIGCNRMGRAALAVGLPFPPPRFHRLGDLELPGVMPVYQIPWPGGDRNEIIAPENAVARISCIFIGLGYEETSFNWTAIIKHLESSFSDVRSRLKNGGNKTISPAFKDYVSVSATGGKTTANMRPELFKMAIYDKSINIKFAAWLLAPKS